MNPKLFMAMSGGERGRIKLAGILAIQHLINMSLNGNGLNLLILDESLSGIDSEGTMEFVNILENIAEIKTDIKDTKDAVNKIDLLKQFKILTEDLDKLEEKTSIPTIGLDKIEQIIMSFKMIADGYILELAEVMDKMETDDLTDILVAVVKPDYEDDEWIDILNLYAGIYYMAENLGIFKDLKVQNGIKDIYRKKYPKNTDKMKPDSRFAKLIQKALYT